MTEPPDIAEPVFIVGMPRSGTTLLATMLNSHPRLAISPETHFLNYWVPQHAHLDVSTPAGFERFWSAFLSGDRFALLDVDRARVEARIRQAGPTSFAVILAAMMQEYALKEGKARWGEKTPGHFPHVAVLLKWYPKARVIYMFRDPRAVAASLLKVDWADRFVHVSAARWAASVRLYESQWRRDDRVCRVSYEELVCHTEETVSRVCDAIGEQYVPEMLLRQSERDRPIRHSGKWAREHFLAARGPVTQDSIDKWKSDLSADQVAIIEHVARKEMVQAGYQPTTRAISLGQAARLALDRLQCQAGRLATALREPGRIARMARRMLYARRRSHL